MPAKHTIKAIVTRASNGTVDLRPVDPDASDVEVITLAVPNSHEMAKKFQPDSVVEVEVPEGKRKGSKVAVITEPDAAEELPETTSRRKRAK